MNSEWLDRAIVRGPCLTLCLTEKEFHRQIRPMGLGETPRWINEGGDATTHSFHNGVGGGFINIVCMNMSGPQDPIMVAGLLVHEAVHVWQHTLKHMHETGTVGDEVEAYAVQNISQQLMWEYVRQTRNGKTN